MSMKLQNKTQRELRRIIGDSAIDENKKALWFRFVDMSPESFVQPIIDVLREDISNLSFLTKNLEDKITAIQTNNVSLARKILNEEKDFIGAK